MLTAFGNFLHRARWWVLLGVLLLLTGAGIFGSGVFSQLKNTSFGDPNSDSARAMQLLDTRLGGSSSDAVLLLRSETLRVSDPAFTQAATDLLTRLHQRAEVASLTSYYSTQSQSFISRDGHETFVLIQLTGQDTQIKSREYTTLQPLLTSPTLQVTKGGIYPVNATVNSLIGTDLEHAELFTFPVLALLLLFVFGGAIAAALPLLIGGVAILVAFATLRLVTLFTDVSIYAINIVTMTGLGLAIDYALFLITRFREELVGDESDVRGALARTMATAGRTVLFSALTVSLSLSSLLLFPLPFLRSMGVGAVATILAVLLTSLTLLPVLLALLGRRINALSLTRLLRRRKQVRGTGEQHGWWYRLSEGVMRWPVPVALAVLVLLVTLGWPVLHINFALADVRMLPANQEARVVSERLQQDFVQQGNAQLTIAITTPGDALASNNLASLDEYVRQIKNIAGVEQVSSLVTVSPALTLPAYQQLYAHPGANPQLTQVAAQLANGNFTKVTVAIQPADHSDAAVTIVNKIRAIHAPGALQPLVDGATASQIDLTAGIARTLPLALLVIAGTVFVLLFLMTGSLVVPLKAIILNIFSLSATFGGLVWIFQDGHLQNLLNFQSTGSVDMTMPVLIFALAFGLSMDYEVFLLSRIKERFDQTGDNRLAVSSGLQRTGWLITSAALLLAIVLGAFGSARIIFIQEVGIGLTIAVIVDATLVRMLLVPATMRLLGTFNWWAPAPLRWLWLRIGLSESAAPPADAESTQATLPVKVL